MPVPEELVAAAVVAARTGRARLAQAIAAVEELPVSEEIRGSLASAVGSLYAVELGGARVVLDGVREAMASLEKVTSGLSESELSESEPVIGAQSIIARTLAELYPAARQLERALADEPIAIPLSRRRRKKVLQLVVEDEDERRVHERVSIEADLGLSSETNFYTGYADDLSDGGLFVATYDLLPVGTELTVSFMLPGGFQITTEGTVRWVRESDELDADLQPGMGIAFQRLTPEQEDAILSYLAHREPIFHDS